MKKLSNKQGENRLNKFCDKVGYTDICGFYGNIYTDDKVIYDMDKGGKRVHLIIDLNNGEIWEE